MKKILSTTLVLSFAFIIYFSAASVSEAKVLFEQSKVGTEYDIFNGAEPITNVLIHRLPQYSGTLPVLNSSGTISYQGTAEWLRLKRISGVECDTRIWLTLSEPDGATRIGDDVLFGRQNGEFCDFKITGPNRTDGKIGIISICYNGQCQFPSNFVLDGSPENEGYVSDGYFAAPESGGWAFQICDIDGCEGGFGSVATTTATTTPPTATSTGASSVLFLPGIMGSRLYEESDICGTGVTEKERWMSTTDCHQIRLLTGMYGDSLNDIYTKDTNEAVIDEAYVFNLYKTFFGELADWKEEGIIEDYALVPYDWRIRLDYLLKTKKDANGKIKYDPNSQITDSYLYKTLMELAENSKTGKVTIVAHSNGGLLTKTLLATLKNMNDPLLDKIDNVILVASPQLGTPGTLLGLLHGDVIGPYGTIISQLTTRRLMNTMPFAFHLLPNASYFNSSGVTVDTPVIKFEAGALTDGLIIKYGNAIETATKMKNFLTLDSGRTKPLVNDLANPEVVPKYLFDNYTDIIDQLMNTWVPPEAMKVYQIAGVGLPTQAGITYFTDRECIARDILKLYKCTVYKNKLGFRVDDTIDGDETVVTPSALSMSDSNENVERWWLNLDKYNSAGIGGSTNINRRHKDILEVQDVIDFVKNTIIPNSGESYEYLTDTAPTLQNESRLVFDLHSPLDLSVVTANGGVISSSTNTIEGAIYKRFGEMQHISIPDNSVKKTVKLNGQATGSFTLEIGEQNGTVITKRHTYSAIPSSTSTKVTLELESSKPIEQAALTVDYDGNGTTEIVYNTTGEVVPEITYATLRTAINNLNIKSVYKTLLIENLKIAEQYQQKPKLKSLERLTLELLKQQVILYEKLKVLTSAQKQVLIDIINKLLSK